MSSEWPFVRIGEVAQVFDGPHATPKKTEFGPVFLGISSLNNGRLDLSMVEHLSDDDFVKWTRRVVPQEEDVVFSYETRLGQAAIIPAGLKCCLGRRMALIRLTRCRLLPRYFLYYFLSEEFQSLLKARTIHGSTVDRLPLTDFPSYPVRLPPLARQRQVCEILKALDDRIDLLRQTNTTLESIAAALFKSWFIDFDPVHAKAEGRVPDGMDSATAALFPSEFEDSELGLIPKGWQVRSLDSLATYLNGLALQKFPAESDNEYLPVIKIAQLRAGNTIGADRASARLKSEYVVRDGDVLFSWSGSLEVEFWCGGDGALNQHLFKVTSDEVPKWLYYLATRHFLPNFQEIAANKATTMGHIQRKHLTGAKIALPPASLISELGRLAAPVLERRVSNAIQARELARLRDILLPRLISGKLRLPEVKPEVEEAIG